VGSYGKRDVPPGVWHQVAVVNDGTAFTVYLDGASLGTSPGAYRFDAKRRTPPVKLAEASVSACFMTDAYRLYDHALTAAEVAADWAAGQPKPGWDGDVAVAALPYVANVRQGFFRTGERIDVRSAGKILRSVVYDKPGVEELVVEGRRFPLCIVPAGVRPVDGLGAVDLVNRQSELLALGIRRTLVKVPWAQIEPARNAYDWTNLDRIDDACAAQGVKAVYLIEGEPGWYAKDRAGQRAQAEKFRRLVAARYEAELVTSADVGFIDLNTGPGQVTRQIGELKQAGKLHLFVKPRPPAWRGRYSAAYAGRPSASLLELLH